MTHAENEIGSTVPFQGGKERPLSSSPTTPRAAPLFGRPMETKPNEVSAQLGYE